MSERMPYHLAVEQAEAHNQLVLALINEQRKLSEIKATERLVVYRDDEVWELEVDDAIPASPEEGIRLMGLAKLVKRIS